MIVTVFGASQTKLGESLYQDSLLLGKLLAESGFSIATGGYIGTMEAVSRGAFEAGGHVIGVTCQEIEDWRPTGANPWVTEEQKQTTLTQRLDVLITQSDALLALPGGIGTLVEIMLTWNRLAIHAISPRPFILIGKGWKNSLTLFIQNQGNYISESDLHYITYVDTVTQAVEYLETSLNK